MKINRSIFNRLCDNLSRPDILILLGARQVGKSTLMESLMEVARQRFEHLRSFNAEFPDDLLFFSKSEAEIFDELATKANTAIFIDEFHYIKNASKIFKALYDTKKNIKIIASGSSSLEIHKHLRESLAGRSNIALIHPLHREEWRQTGGKLEDFFVYGGLPGLVHLQNREEKIDYLAQMVQTYILKDIKGLMKEENISAFNHLLFYLAEHQGHITATSNVAREMGMTARTIERYFTILEQTFVLHPLPSFSRNLSNELKKSKKYYFYDNGIRNSLIKDFSGLATRDDGGTLRESHVFLELHKRRKGNTDLRFWRTKQGDEVDFIWIKDRRPIPIKSHYKGTRPPKGLVKFLKNYPESPCGFILRQERADNLKLDRGNIKFQTFDDIASLPL